MNQELKVLIDTPFGILSDDNMIYDSEGNLYWKLRQGSQQGRKIPELIFGRESP